MRGMGLFYEGSDASHFFQELEDENKDFPKTQIGKSIKTRVQFNMGLIGFHMVQELVTQVKEGPDGPEVQYKAERGIMKVKAAGEERGMKVQTGEGRG